jgi:divalent metal cation (Fe/Co/Zn/Cd) transporter
VPGSDVVVELEPRRRGLDLRDRVLASALAEPLVKEVRDITIFEHDRSVSVSLHLKFPADLDLRTALTVAERIEQAIRARPGVSDVQTHLEPLERPQIARHGDTTADLDAMREIKHIVLERTDSEPRGVRLLITQAGRVVFLTLAIDAETPLVDAHQLASDVEEHLRQRVPDIADVVVHTDTCQR